jgi:hypothetical protein
MKARKQAKNEHPQSPKKDQYDSPKQGATMISNVQRATAAEYSNSSDTDEDSAVEQMNILELKIRSIFAGMAHRVGEENIRCNGDYEEVLANLSKATHESYATADSGADTNVLGKE